MARSFRKLIESLPASLSEPMRTKSAHDWLLRCAREAQVTAAFRCRMDAPAALRVAAAHAERSSYIRFDLEEKIRAKFAAVAVLYDEGFQPFLANLAPPADPDFAKLLPDTHELVRLVEQNERLYQEQSSRWLVAAHFVVALYVYEEENPLCFECIHDDDKMSIEQGVGLVDIISKWWPWIDLCAAAAKEEGRDIPSIRARDMKTVFIDWKDLGAAELRPNARYASKRRASKRRSRRTSRRKSRR